MLSGEVFDEPERSIGHDWSNGVQRGIMNVIRVQPTTTFVQQGSGQNFRVPWTLFADQLRL